jgi:4-diphosphocytidyl-2-C-methyl-D-erythritol kinase
LETITLKAPAKINLFLYVISKRDDGYHNIESLLQAIDLFDDITLEKSDTIELACSDPAAPAGERNLAYKAAVILQSHFYFPGVKITLNKKIPSGAGLGGGSSDAAFVMRGLLRLYNLKPTPAEINELAAKVGSDVPFFLSTGQALIEGRGEIVKTVDLPVSYDIAVVSPPFSISTSEIYRRVKLDLTSDARYRLLSKKIDLSRLVRISRDFRNDLEDIVISIHSDLSDLKRSLLGTGAFYCAMTGSGSSFFGLYGRGARLVGRFESLKERGYRVVFCKPILLPPTTI